MLAPHRRLGLTTLGAARTGLDAGLRHRAIARLHGFARSVRPCEMSAMQHVLVVDDDPDIRETLAHRLANEGYSVDLARDGAEALAQLSDGCSPDAIVLDLGMPTMNGWQFRDLQRHPRLAEIPSSS